MCPYLNLHFNNLIFQNRDCYFESKILIVNYFKFVVHEKSNFKNLIHYEYSIWFIN